MTEIIIVLSIFLFVSVGLNYAFIKWVHDLEKELKKNKDDKENKSSED